MATHSGSRQNIASIAGSVFLGVLGAVAIAYLYAHVVATESYALMHLLTELVRIVVAVAAFMVVWNTRESIGNGSIVIVAVAGVCVAGIDLFHALMYQGVNLIATGDPGLAPELRLAARDLQAISLLVAASYAGRKVRPGRVLLLFAMAAVALVTAVAWTDITPAAFDPATGPTPFAVANEYAIAAVMLLALWVLVAKRDRFDRTFLAAMAAALVCFIAAELAFARFPQPDSIVNFLGHLVSLTGALLVYRAMVIEAVARPFEVLFSEFSSTLTALERSEERFRATFDQATVGILEIDREGRIVRANPRARELSGRDDADLLGMLANELTHIDDRDSEGRMTTALEAGEIREYRIEKRICGNGREPAWVSANRSAVLDDAGQARYYLELLEDITARRQAEETVARARDLKSTLLAIDVAINSTFDIDEILVTAVTESARAISAESAVVAMRDKGGWTIHTAWRFPQDLEGTHLDSTQMARLVDTDPGGLPLAIEDALHDPRVQPEFAKRYDIRSVIVIPLSFRGEDIGLLFFNYHSAKRAFTEDEIGFVLELSSALTLAIENSRLYEAERRTVDTLQESLLRIEEDLAGTDIATAYYSAVSLARIGGDFFDVFMLPEERLAFAVGDVAGKGIEAAAIAAIAKSTVRAFAYEWGTPARVVRATNQALLRQLDEGRFVTLVYGLIDLHSGETRIVCAGHPSPLVCDEDGAVEDVSVHNPPLAVFDMMDFEEFRTMLRPNMRVVAFSDGLLDARSGEEFLGEERVRDLVARMGDADPRALVDDLMTAAQSHSDGHPPDDIAIIALRYQGPPDVDATD